MMTERSLIFHISTHAPRTGGDQVAAELAEEIAISTHAPRTGGDACFCI